MMKATDITDIETALMRADEHMAQAEGLAPAGICTQWCQLARVELQRAQAVIAGQMAQKVTQA